MATTVLARGCKFCAVCLNNGWGSHTDAEVKVLTNAVRTEFESRAQAALGDPSVTWHPAVSEIWYECTGESPNWSAPVNGPHTDDVDLEQILSESEEFVFENSELYLNNR